MTTAIGYLIGITVGKIMFRYPSHNFDWILWDLKTRNWKLVTGYWVEVSFRSA